MSVCELAKAVEMEFGHILAVEASWKEQTMSNDTIKRSDAIKAVWGENINPSEDGMVFEAQSHIDRDIRLIPSTDSPQEDYNRGYCDAVQGIADEMVKQGKCIVQDRPQGEWIDKAISIIDDMQREGIIDYEQAREYRMRARMKGADDETD